MKVLIIPDIHLKAWIFSMAEKMAKEEKPNKIICLGDLVDDFGKENDPTAYHDLFETAFNFEKNHPDMLWCYGNHDVAYIINEEVTGTSQSLAVRYEIHEGMKKLYDSIPENNLSVVHQIDNVIFSHAGISQMFVKDHFERADWNKTEKVIQDINKMNLGELWYSESPLWLRPQKKYRKFIIRMYRPRKYFQVVGHSPMHEITQENNLLTCDTFSTYRDGRPFGDQTFCLIDTKTWKWKGK